jgi:hypothetical protein
VSWEAPDDHDQRFKTLIREFFPDFMNLFFENWANRFDLSQIEWLDSELLPNPPEGTRHRVDLIAKLRCLEEIEGYGSDWLALVHIEIESRDSASSIKSRLPRYYLHLRDKYGYPVLPIVLFLSVAYDGLGVDTVTESFWELDVLRLKYLYVGLPGLEGEKYIQGENSLGIALAALMKLPKADLFDLAWQALSKIHGKGLTEQQVYLLSECFESYSKLSEQELISLLERIPSRSQEKRMGVLKRNRTTYDIEKERLMAEARELALLEGKAQGVAEGKAEGKAEGERLARIELVQLLFTAKFGTIPDGISMKLANLPDSSLKQLAIAITKAATVEELNLID